MKVTDLMIGDWVYNKHHKENIQIKPYDFFVHGHGNNGGFVVSSTIVSGKDFDPIPLTEEILVKNGFEKTTNDWNRHGRPLIIFESMGFPTISIHADMDMKHFWVHGTIDLTYVHQLQHLLRLVGVQKEIEL